MWCNRRYASPLMLLHVYAPDIVACQTTARITAREFYTKRIMAPLVMNISIDGVSVIRTVLSPN